MNNCSTFLFRILVSILLVISFSSCSNESNSSFQELVKLSLRDAGHRILLADRDSTSLVQPIIAKDEYRYQLAFESPVAINPDSLVSIVKSSFQKAALPPHYLTEVIRCENGEVAYSYEMRQNIEKGIIPCSGRQLPKACYTINVRFDNTGSPTQNNASYLYLLPLVILLPIAFLYYVRGKKRIPDAGKINYTAIGRFKFYPEQNKLIKEAVEINLSKKECELLALFVAQPNQVIKRDALTKKVWEDNGVIVGRSLDTYISKLRKKLQADDSVKLTNVHGVGYKLEIDS